MVITHSWHRVMGAVASQDVMRAVWIMLRSIIMASQLHAPVQGGLITWKSGQIRTNLCEGGVTRVTNPADAALAGAIYACGGIIVLRGHNYICTHTFVLSTTHRTPRPRSLIPMRSWGGPWTVCCLCAVPWLIIIAGVWSSVYFGDCFLIV